MNVMVISVFGTECVWRYSNNWCVILIFANEDVWLPFCFIISPLEYRGCAMSEGVLALTQTVSSNSRGFLGTFNGNYDLVIIDVHAVNRSYFIVHNALTSNCRGFLGTFNGNYDLVIIDVHAVNRSYFIVHNALSSELKIYHVTLTCLNCVCCARYTVISALYM
jgi:hypothetical protein